MYAELEIEPSAVAVARHFGSLLNGYVIDHPDQNLTKLIGLPTLITDTIMVEREQRQSLAEEVLSFAREHW
jgi:LPPG:FO 2-phospho-L-lactate transferase